MKPNLPKLATRRATVAAFHLDIPAEWVVGTNARGIEWAGDERDTITLLIQPELIELSEEAVLSGRSPAQHAE